MNNNIYDKGSVPLQQPNAARRPGRQTFGNLRLSGPGVKSDASGSVPLQQPNAARRPGWQTFGNLRLSEPGVKWDASDMIPRQFLKNLLPERDGGEKVLSF